MVLDNFTVLPKVIVGGAYGTPRRHAIECAACCLLPQVRPPLFSETCGEGGDTLAVAAALSSIGTRDNVLQDRSPVCVVNWNIGVSERHADERAFVESSAVTHTSRDSGKTLDTDSN